MLLIRKATMTALEDISRDRFVREVRDIFAGAYPRECLQAGGEAGMLAWVEHGIQQAADAGFTTKKQCGRWLTLMMMLGADFHRDPQLPWVKASLEAEALPVAHRLDHLFEEALDYLGQTAGDDGLPARHDKGAVHPHLDPGRRRAAGHEG